MMGLCSATAFAQTGRVGINTEKPTATLNVKAKTNDGSKVLELENNQAAKLVSVLDNGNVGIGTENPSQKLDIVGKVKITDGTQGTGRVLTSDADGNATWQLLSIGNKTANISLRNDALIIGRDWVKEVYTNTTKQYDDIGITLNTEGIVIPKGRYIIYQIHDINGPEYCRIRLQKKSDNQTIYQTYYGEWLNASYMIDLPQDEELYFSINCSISNPNSDYYMKNDMYESGREIDNTLYILKLN